MVEVYFWGGRKAKWSFGGGVVLGIKRAGRHRFQRQGKAASSPRLRRGQAAALQRTVTEN